MTGVFAWSAVLSLALVILICLWFLRADQKATTVPNHWYWGKIRPATLEEREQAHKATSGLYAAPEQAQKRARMPSDETDRITVVGTGERHRERQGA